MAEEDKLGEIIDNNNNPNKDVADKSSKLSGFQIFLTVINLVNFIGFIAIAIMIVFFVKRQSEVDLVKEVIDKFEKTDNKNSFFSQNIPLDSFVVNLADSKGRKLAKLTLEIEVNKENVYSEVEAKKPQIRDIVIHILSSKTFNQMSDTQGKDIFKKEIINAINSFLTSGEIKNIWFTDFIFN